MTLGFALQIAATATTLASLWYMADVRLAGPVLGQISNVLWIALNLHYELFGLLPISIVMIVLHARTYHKWKGAA